MARSGMRSSALARAQAQLAGQRVPIKPIDAADELQEYMHALNKKTSALKLSQPSVADLSEFSPEEQESEKYRAADGPQQVSEMHSRFLKKKPPSNNDVKSNAVVAIGANKPVHPQPVQSKTPTSAALRKLAEIENRHRLRKLEIDVSENDSDLRTSEERPFSNRSSSELSSHEKRLSKKKINIMKPELTRQNVHVENKTSKYKPGSIESEEEEILHLVGSSVEFSENDQQWKVPKPPRTPSPPSKSTPRRKLRHNHSALAFVSPHHPSSHSPSRTPSPPSYGSPRFPRRTHSFTRFRSRSPSPSVRSPLTSPSPRTRLGRRSRTPVSQRSDVKSLDELFRPEDLSSASSNDFKLNILSLDDLAIPIDAEKPRVKTVSEKPKNIKHVSSAEIKGHSRSRDAKSFIRQSISEEESVVEAHTETNKDSEILTHRHKEHSSSSEHYISESSDESTINSVYSEDFEESVVTDTERSSKSHSYSYSKTRSAKKSVLSSHHSYTPSSKAREWGKTAGNVQRVTVKEIAVQASDPGFTYHWPNAGIEHIAAPFMDPLSLVSHVVSPDLIEALTTYNPMALALNDMLKQQLFLTRSFVDMAQQLYLSTVRSVENESYCYTTLENTKEYIQQQMALKWKQDA